MNRQKLRYIDKCSPGWALNTSIQFFGSFTFCFQNLLLWSLFWILHELVKFHSCSFSPSACPPSGASPCAPSPCTSPRAWFIFVVSSAAKCAFGFRSSEGNVHHNRPRQHPCHRLPRKNLRNHSLSIIYLNGAEQWKLGCNGRQHGRQTSNERYQLPFRSKVMYLLLTIRLCTKMKFKRNSTHWSRRRTQASYIRERVKCSTHKPKGMRP